MDAIVKKSVTLPEELWVEVEKAAAADMRSVSSFVSKALAERLNWKPVEAEEVAS
jgi:metal-responsive CopG/Arc/MetJ family transcriptional regulator